jgi:hypothetical protein
VLNLVQKYVKNIPTHSVINVFCVNKHGLKTMRIRKFRFSRVLYSGSVFK